MSQAPTNKKTGFSLDWLVQGVLTKVGDIFDRMTGRGWKPSSSLATSGIVEKMKSLMDAEAKATDAGKKYVPHNIRLKMQWDKFSTDSDRALTSLENELLVAAVDHINDRHYYTYAPLSVIVKPDYFINGVELLVGFEKLKAGESEVGVNVSVPDAKPGQLVPPPEPEKIQRDVKFKFSVEGKPVSKDIEMTEGARISVGRTKENALAIADHSVSKMHASLLLDKSGRLIVADTGSTNGTFLQGQRIPYGKAFIAGEKGKILFGTIPVEFSIEERQLPVAEPAVTEKYEVGAMTFETRRPEPTISAAKTEVLPIATTAAAVTGIEADKEVEKKDS